MKLRNKKTGEHGDYKVISAGNLIRVHDSASDESWQYDSLASFNEKWEDYTPKEPLIQWDKHRKLLSEWAKVTQTINILPVKRRTSQGKAFTEFFSQDACISISLFGDFIRIKDMTEYTIDDLCGEEK